MIKYGSYPKKLLAKGDFSQFSTVLQNIISKIPTSGSNYLLSQNPVIQVQITGGSNESVTVWDFHQIILVDAEMKIYTGGDVSYSSRTGFWKKIPELAHSIRNSIFQNLNLELEKSTKNFNPIQYIGYYGYLGFEVSRFLEFYQYRDDEPRFPSVILVFPTKYFIENNSTCHIIELKLPVTEFPEINIDEKTITESMIHHSITFQTYLQKLQQIKHYIAQGEIYQTNFTQAFTVQNISSKREAMHELYTQIKNIQNVNHLAFLQFSTFGIFSLSPELFLKCINGNLITKPIKGTRPRGKNEDEDKKLISELQLSTKDNAELSMIVDLLRNDLGKSAMPATVNVTTHAIIETYENVHHLVSCIECQIPPSFEDSWRTLLRAFPGGSISGVPKLRSLEIIEETENIPREVYTGSIGMISLDGTMEFNIAIRTAIFTENQIMFNAGGGIVYDSNPFDEYLESLHKAKHLAGYFGYSFTGHLIWINGEFRETETMQLDLQPYGCFETIKVENGKPLKLNAHLNRLKKGLEYYSIDVSLIPSERSISDLIKLNLVNLGRLNIYVYSEHSQPQVVMKISNYQMQSGDYDLLLPDTPFDLVKPMALGIKSLQYENYRRYTELATTNECYDSILYDDKGNLLEGGRCTIYLYIDDWITPKSNVVKGITRSELIKNGLVRLTDIKISLASITRIKAVAISNAMIGLQEIRSIFHNGELIWIKSESSLYFTNLRRDYIDLKRSMNKRTPKDA